MKQGSAIRGIVFGILFTLPIWAFIFWLVRKLWVS